MNVRSYGTKANYMCLMKLRFSSNNFEVLYGKYYGEQNKAKGGYVEI